MKLHKLKDQGFAHMILVLVIVGVVVAGAFALVLKARHDRSTKASQTAATSQTSASAQSKTGVSTNATELSTTSAAKDTTPAPAPTKSSTSTSKSTSTPASTSSKPTTPAQTPLSALIAIITALDNGTADANVTVNSVDVPGPITTAHARPIVFSLNGKTYFAYTQGTAPNFGLTASQTANTMALVSATVSSPPLIEAHLDKTGNLVDANIAAVGYSTGGN